MAEHLPDEERVPLRLVVDRPGQSDAGLVECPARRLLDEGGHGHVVEAGERQPFDAELGPQTGDDFHQRMIVGQLAVPIRAHDQDPSTADPQDVTQEEQRRLGRPLQVVEHQQ